MADSGLEETTPSAETALVKRIKTLLKNRSLYQDFRQGVQLMQDWMSHAPEEAFHKMEEIQLRYRLTKIQKKLFDAYSILGMQAMDHFKGEGVSEEERDQVYRQITTLKEEQKQIEVEMEELKTLRTLEKE